MSGTIRNCVLFFEYNRTNFDRFRKWQRSRFQRINKPTNKKQKRPKFYQFAWSQLIREHRENEFLIAKFFETTPDRIRFWSMFDYYSALEEILKESDRIAERNRIQQTKK